MSLGHPRQLPVAGVCRQAAYTWLVSKPYRRVDGGRTHHNRSVKTSCGGAVVGAARRWSLVGGIVAGLMLLEQVANGGAAGEVRQGKGKVEVADDACACVPGSMSVDDGLVWCVVCGVLYLTLSCTVSNAGPGSGSGMGWSPHFLRKLHVLTRPTY